jgi:hypothetical protein
MKLEKAKRKRAAKQDETTDEDPSEDVQKPTEAKKNKVTKAGGKTDIRSFFGGGSKPEVTNTAKEFGPVIKIISWNVNGFRALQKSEGLAKVWCCSFGV